MRYLSFRFDDGFWDGAIRADVLLEPDQASFFIIGDLVEGREIAGIPLFEGRRFGSILDWERLVAKGHDVQPHGMRHAAFSELDPRRQLEEVQESVRLVRRIGTETIVFCFPFNIWADLDFEAIGVDGAGFATVTSDRPPIWNDLNNLCAHRLRSWAVRERHIGFVADELAKVPDEAWVILAFHSLDGEGHEPWTSAGFADLVHAVRDQDFRIVTVGRMIEQWKRGEARAPARRGA